MSDILSATPADFQSHLDAGMGMEDIARHYGVPVTMIGQLDFFRSAKKKAGFRAPPSVAFGTPVLLTERRFYECAVIINEELPYQCCGAPITSRFRLCAQHARTMLTKGAR